MGMYRQKPCFATNGFNLTAGDYACKTPLHLEITMITCWVFLLFLSLGSRIPQGHRGACKFSLRNPDTALQAKDLHVADGSSEWGGRRRLQSGQEHQPQTSAAPSSD